jgi:hypothetical protein
MLSFLRYTDDTVREFTGKTGVKWIILAFAVAAVAPILVEAAMPEGMRDQMLVWLVCKLLPFVLPHIGH